MEENQTQENTVKKGSPKFGVPVVIIGIIVIAIVGVYALQGQETDIQKAENKVTATDIPRDGSSIEPRSNSVVDESDEAEYMDGEYTATGAYTSPGGAEQIGVTLTLKGGVIADADIETIGDRPNTVRFQGIFKENYRQFVIGKNIDELELDKVAGASLSPKGFNDALEQIKMDARA